MTSKLFTEEQLAVLRRNPNTQYVSASVIKFTQEFKEKLAEAIRRGAQIRPFFQEAGYDYDMLGNARIKTIVSRMRKEVNAGRTPHAGYKKRKRHPDLEDYKEMSSEEAMQRMQTEILYLHQELDFIKKIFEMDNTGGQS